MTSKQPFVETPWYQTMILFFILFFWAVFSGWVAEFSLTFIVTEPVTWIILSTLYLLGLTLQIFFLTRWMKSSLHFPELEWQYKKAYVEYDEYKKMASEYHISYSFALAQGLQIMPLLVSLLIAIIAILLPVYWAMTVPYLLVSLPGIFGIEVMIFSISLSIALYRMMPSSQKSGFRAANPKLFEKAMKIFEEIDDISWYGIECLIGESGGYFTIPEARPVGRVSGFESVIGIILYVDERGITSKVVGWVTETSNQTDEFKTKIEISSPTIIMIEDLIDSLIEQYLDSRELDVDTKELLEEF